VRHQPADQVKADLRDGQRALKNGPEAHLLRANGENRRIGEKAHVRAEDGPRTTVLLRVTYVAPLHGAIRVLGDAPVMKGQRHADQEKMTVSFAMHVRIVATVNHLGVPVLLDLPRDDLRGRHEDLVTPNRVLPANLVRTEKTVLTRRHVALVQSETQVVVRNVQIASKAQVEGNVHLATDRRDLQRRFRRSKKNVKRQANALETKGGAALLERARSTSLVPAKRWSKRRVSRELQILWPRGSQ
jgi:hypothetical protein